MTDSNQNWKIRTQEFLETHGWLKFHGLNRFAEESDSQIVLTGPMEAINKLYITLAKCVKSKAETPVRKMVQLMGIDTELLGAEPPFSHPIFGETSLADFLDGIVVYGLKRQKADTISLNFSSWCPFSDFFVHHMRQHYPLLEIYYRYEFSPIDGRSGAYKVILSNDSQRRFFSDTDHFEAVVVDDYGKMHWHSNGYLKTRDVSEFVEKIIPKAIDERDRLCKECADDFYVHLYFLEDPECERRQNP